MDHDTKTIETIKKDISRIRKAGSSAQVLGWLLLLAAAGVVWLLQSKTQVFICYGTLTVLGLYFIYSGKYIKVGRGRGTKGFLFINGLLSLPLCFAIYPILVCVQSFNNLGRFKDLPRNIQDIYNKPKKLHVSWLEIVLILFILLAGVTSVFLKMKSISNEVAKSSASQAQAPAIDTVSKSHFSVSFPGSFTATDLTTQVSGHPVNSTVYTSNGSTEAKLFIISAFNYPSAYFNYGKMSQASLTPVIHSATFGAIHDLHGTPVSSTSSTFLDNTSEDTTFSSQTLTGTMTGYARVFFVGNYKYMIITVGASQSEFNDFANSFKYIK